MQEQLSTGRLMAGGRNQPWGPAVPYTGDGDGAPSVETEPTIVEKQPPLVLRALRSVGGAFAALWLSGASTNCGCCNAPIDGNTEAKSNGSPVAASVNYRCRRCGHSWEQYLFIDPWA